MFRDLRTPLWIAALALVLAFGFLGTRGIWDPDEGRYTNVALIMLDSGDWLNPRRSDEVGHWTKPPLTYWAIAGSVAALGQNTWAVRLPSALAYLLSVWLAWRVARRLAPGSERMAAIAYATMLMTFGTAGFISTDYLLAATTGLAMYAFVEARFGNPANAHHWTAAMWAAFALAFITKGPPALVYLLAILAFDWLLPARRSSRILHASGVLLFALLALPWYIAVVANHPGLLRYFLGDEVVNRVASSEFHRNSEWYGFLKVYLPTLALGTLPWTPALWRWLRALPMQVRRWRDQRQRVEDASALLLALWVLVPLLVFCVSRSRLPLYLLPLFLPLAVIVARQRAQEGRGESRWRWLLVWAALLLSLRVATAYWPTHKDAAAWAQALRERVPGRIDEVVFVEDMARYGLHLHLGPGTRIEKISLDPVASPRFNPTFDESLASELAEAGHHEVWVCKQALWPTVQRRIAAQDYRAQAQGEPYEERIIFTVARQRN